MFFNFRTTTIASFAHILDAWAETLVPSSQIEPSIWYAALAVSSMSVYTGLINEQAVTGQPRLGFEHQYLNVALVNYNKSILRLIDILNQPALDDAAKLSALSTSIMLIAINFIQGEHDEGSRQAASACNLFHQWDVERLLARNVTVAQSHGVINAIEMFDRMVAQHNFGPAKVSLRPNAQLISTKHFTNTDEIWREYTALMKLITSNALDGSAKAIYTADPSQWEDMPEYQHRLKCDKWYSIWEKKLDHFNHRRTQKLTEDSRVMALEACRYYPECMLNYPMINKAPWRLPSRGDIADVAAYVAFTSEKHCEMEMEDTRNNGHIYQAITFFEVMFMCASMYRNREALQDLIDFLDRTQKIHLPVFLAYSRLRGAMETKEQEGLKHNAIEDCSCAPDEEACHLHQITRVHFDFINSCSCKVTIVNEYEHHQDLPGTQTTISWA